MIFPQGGGGGGQVARSATETTVASRGKVRWGVWVVSPKRIWNMKCSRSDSEHT